ncbi:gp16 terminase DNA packaging enzyme small subunit [Delftia phage PhiW-14]|uniref:Gp16 terminase DNA packaging enzyme small subunit n=1 Tax=Delftia phage PhiW-14 TaxID=665032 RepID=C9DG19_BPW14|nr:terminase small subunit [Delftia phage PhiW-14]ACV50070.1 gp16 terminase DNA packaging enzyme small subunit [Delftia phage PhiW-14]
MSRDALKDALGIGGPPSDDRALIDGLLGQTAGEMGMSLDEFKELPPERQTLIIEQLKSNIKSNDTDDVADDYHKSRDNMSALLGIMMQAVSTASQVALQTEHPRAFDSLNALANTTRAIAMDVLNIQKKLSEIQNPVSGGVNVNVNAGAVPGSGTMGSHTTASILELLRDNAGTLQALSSTGTKFQPKPLPVAQHVEVKADGQG